LRWTAAQITHNGMLLVTFPKLTHNIMVTENEEKTRLEVKEKIKSQSNHNHLKPEGTYKADTLALR